MESQHINLQHSQKVYETRLQIDIFERSEPANIYV